MGGAQAQQEEEKREEEEGEDGPLGYRHDKQWSHEKR